jgi:hypothetical protein
MHKEVMIIYEAGARVIVHPIPMPSLSPLECLLTGLKNHNIMAIYHISRHMHILLEVFPLETPMELPLKVTISILLVCMRWMPSTQIC